MNYDAIRENSRYNISLPDPECPCENCAKYRGHFVMAFNFSDGRTLVAHHPDLSTVLRDMAKQLEDWGGLYNLAEIAQRGHVNG